ncbi:DNA mismatch repair protein MutS [Sediminibacterium roseum]|uniref:DNA mismatch repair protein MutS n=1 Tax=Sediminibacterium roseum TaxID=1978412 RepID=A0ABW9ZRQ2_9BACT|nr:DNA mismatch repair protein MutS [Sediminibacterium roseum]NCI48733.1 DNA mismatch repair protein MutS [Sediminibacterium roseum]
MLVDKTTLADLSIFHSEEEQSVFHHLNYTQTNVGREYLRHLLGAPLGSIDTILDTQKTIQLLQSVEKEWPIAVTNGTIMVMERFYESQFSKFAHQPNAVNAQFYKIFYNPDYSLLRYTVEHAIDFTRGLQKIIDLLQERNLSKQLAGWITRISMLLNKEMVKEMMHEDKKTLSPVQVLRYGGFIRFHYKSQVFELADIYSRLDAYLSLAIACTKYNFCFPEIQAGTEPYIKAKGLNHMMLTEPVSYDIEISREKKNFLFLTGANMAGKSTFIKAVGISAYLAHLGMGVPAREMQLSMLDGMLSNIQVVDNIIKGESFFFNEVQRIKNTIEKISDGKNWLILIDELFKGTNQQDAVKCSITVIEGLRKMQNALFILSTHLYEIGADLRKYDNIQFHYFETAVEGDQLMFSYQLKDGISNDRLGYLILKKEGVVDLLEKL